MLRMLRIPRRIVPSTASTQLRQERLAYPAETRLTTMNLYSHKKKYKGDRTLRNEQALVY